MLPLPNLKKKRNEKEGVDEGEVVPQKEPKQQRMAKDKGRASLVESKKAEHFANLCHLAWNPRLELDGATVPWSSSIREFWRGYAHYVAEALEQPLLLPKDMEALKNMRQHDIFMSLKRDLALVIFSTWSH